LPSCSVCVHRDEETPHVTDKFETSRENPISRPGCGCSQHGMVGEPPAPFASFAASAKDHAIWAKHQSQGILDEQSRGCRRCIQESVQGGHAGNLLVAEWDVSASEPDAG